MKLLAALLCLLGHPVWADCLDLTPLGLTLGVEEPVTLKQDAEGVALQFDPQGRAPRGIALIPLPAGHAYQSMDWPKHADLGAGWTIAYASGVVEAEGSGGAEAQLQGWMSGPASLAVSCTRQGESPDPEWCLPILGQLRPIAEQSCGAARDGALTKAEAADCAAKGGRIGIAGKLGREFCILPAPDAGKSCAKASDCAAWCEAETRTCAPELSPFGCRNYLDETGAEVSICVD